MSQSVILQAINLSKKFYLQKQKTFKEFLPALFSGHSWAKEFWALKDISFAISRGESLGILGKNGAGKSTLLKLIAGVTAPSFGDLKVNGQVAPLIELGAGFHPELTGLENIYLNGSILGMRKKEIDKKLDEIIDFSELKDFIDQPIKHYSSGMYMRLAFSVAIAETPDILLIDEIFAVGDLSFQKKCLDKMREFKKNNVTMIIVSHTLDYMKEFCENGLVIDDGREIYFGDLEGAVSLYQKIMD